MQRISLSGSDVSYSRLIYGMWRLADDSNTSTAHVRAKVDTALSEGITTFDHADIYGNYQCEALLGNALKDDPGLRQQIEIVSKCDIMMQSDKFPERRVGHYDTSAKHINWSVERSLQFLHTDYLDTLLLHRPDALMDAAETGAALDTLIDSGKVRSVGVSNFYPDDWRLLQKHMNHKLAVNQVELNVLAYQSFLDGLLSALQLDDIAVMAWSPLAGGRLFGDDEVAQRVMPLLQSIAEAQNSRVDLVALAWLLRHPANIMPVAGSNRLDRISGMAGALEIDMDRQSWFEILVAAQGKPVP